MSSFGFGPLHGTRLPVGRAWLTALLFALVACRSTPATAPNRPAPAARSPDAPPAPGTDSRTEAPPEAAESALPNRVGAIGSTRGTVACGVSRCRVPGELCVLLGSTANARAPSWQCVASDRKLEDEQRYACDDASDCAGGQACCLGLESAFVAYACSARSGAQANCALESCVTEGGVPCPVGQACREGTCAPADARATCNGGQRCPASAPICVWANGNATCASDSPLAAPSAPKPNELRMSCASHEDCGAGLHCCSNALGDATGCRVACDLANNLQLCRSDADCRGASSAKMRCLPAHAENPGHFPAWVRVCSAP